MKPTVLVVEDDKSVAYMLKVVLTEADFAVRLAADGVTGWEAFQAKRPDIVLSDIKMPRMDGVELLGKIKAADPEMDVVLLTGHGELPTAIQALELGAYRYLEKPVRQITDLTQTLKEALEKRQLVRDRRLIDRISQDLSRRLSLPDFTDQFLRHILAAFPRINAAFVSLCYSPGDCMTVLRARGFPDSQAMVGLKTRASWSIGAQAFDRAAPARLDVGALGMDAVEKLRDRGFPPPLLELVRAHPTMGALGLPIVSKDEPIGSLTVVNYDSLDELDDHLTGLLTTLCRQIGLYLRNATLYADLQAQTGRLQAVLDSTADGMMVIDPAGQVIMTNPRFQTMLQSGGRAAAGEHRARLIADLQDQLAGREQADFDFTLERPASDEPITLQVYAAQVRREGESMGVVASLRDVTLLRSLDRKRDNILQLTKHEAHTPLTIINLYVRNLLTLGSKLTEEQRAETLRRIAQQTEEMDRLIAETLDYSRLKGTLLTRERTRLDLSQLADELAQESTVLAAQSELLFTAHVEPGLRVMGDSLTLKRAFRNLLDNARKFTPAGGTITWRVYRDGDSVKAQVEDSGVGIFPDEMDEIFTPYFRGSSAGDTSGTGLGLSFVWGIIHAHRGKIVVESKENEGSRFTVTLPAAPTQTAR